MGLSLPFPILPTLLLDPHSEFLKGDLYQNHRTVIFGFIIAVYSFGQWIGSPIMGRGADVIGRKKTLVVSLAGNIIAYCICALSIYLKNIWPLLIGRFLAGFTESSCCIAQTMATDTHSSKVKVKNFSYINTAASIGWVLGPLLGGWLVVVFPTISIVFLFPALFSALMIPFLIISYTDSKKSLKSSTFFNPFAFPFQIKILLLMNFMIYFGFSSFQQYFPNLLILKLDANSMTIGYFYTILSVFWIGSQFFLAPRLIEYIPAKNIFKIFSFIIAISIFSIGIFSSMIPLIFFIAFVGISGAICFTYAVSMISDITSKDTQGTVLGINRSCQSLARTAPALIMGFAASFDARIPLFFGCIICLFAMSLCVYHQRKIDFLEINSRI